MAGDVCRRAVPETISRPALGRVARPGDLYDVTKEKFCGVSIFRKRLLRDSPAVSRTDNPQSDFSFTTISSLQEKLQKLNVTGELKLNILAGMFEFEGSAKYLGHKKDSFKSVESTLLHSVKTVTEHLEFSHEHVQDYISREVTRYSSAMYVVVEIEWGANCIITVTDQNRENRHKREVEAGMKVQLEKLQQLLTMTEETEGDDAQEETYEWKKFSFDIFGDVLPEGLDEFPQTLDDALALMRKLPQMSRRYNDGKGMPLKYVMLPVSHLASHKPSPPLKTFVNAGETWTIKIVKLFDVITELRQKVYDLVEELTDYSYCMTANELEEARRIKDELEVQEAAEKQELIQLLEDIRSAREDADCLDEFCNKHRQTAKDMFRECEIIYESIQRRIEFSKRCERFGAEYLAPPVDLRIAGACDDYDNVYVLFHGDDDPETMTRNESAFIELAK